MKRIELEGKRFGRWSVLSYLRNTNNNSIYLCVCDCGKKKEVNGRNMKNGTTKSCGCLMVEGVINRAQKYRTRISGIRQAMIRRCYVKGNVSYKNYGARGIRVCKEWKNSAESFYNWMMENKWEPGLDIDRIDNNKDYGPDNCRVVTRLENCQNKRNTRKYALFGFQKTIREIADLTNLSYFKIKGMLRSKKCTAEKILWSHLKEQLNYLS